MFTFELHKLTQWHLGLEEFLSTYCQDFLSCEGHSTILINTSKFNPTGPYTRGYLAALHFLRGCCEIRRLPWSKNNKNKKIIINLIFASRLSLFLYRGWCFAAAGKHYFEPISGCRMAPQQVEIRLPRYTRYYTVPFKSFALSSLVLRSCDVIVIDRLTKVTNNLRNWA